MEGCTSGEVYKRLAPEYVYPVKQDLVILANLGVKGVGSPLFSDDSTSNSTCSTSSCSSHSRNSTTVDKPRVATPGDVSQSAGELSDDSVGDDVGNGMKTSTPKNKQRVIVETSGGRSQQFKRMLSPLARSTVSIPIRPGNYTVADFMAANGGGDVVVAQTGGGLWANAFSDKTAMPASKGTRGTVARTPLNKVVTVRFCFMYFPYRQLTSTSPSKTASPSKSGRRNMDMDVIILSDSEDEMPLAKRYRQSKAGSESHRHFNFVYELTIYRICRNCWRRCKWDVGSSQIQNERDQSRRGFETYPGDGCCDQRPASEGGTSTEM